MGTMATDPHLGTRIKRARERKRWTQQRLADTVGVSQKTIDNWENGRTSPRSSIGALEEVLGVSLDDAPPPSDMEPQDNHERLIISNDDLTNDDKRLLIRSYRKARAAMAAAAPPEVRSPREDDRAPRYPDRPAAAS